MESIDKIQRIIDYLTAESASPGAVRMLEISRIMAIHAFVYGD